VPIKNAFNQNLERYLFNIKRFAVPTICLTLVLELSFNFKLLLKSVGSVVLSFALCFKTNFRVFFGIRTCSERYPLYSISVE
jgi:hypothetical protein